MIHEFAIDPADVFEKHGFWTLLREFGVSSGRVLVECPADSWEKEMQQALCRARQELGWRTFQALTEQLAGLRKRKALVRRSNGIVSTGTRAWIDTALEEHRRSPFHGILTEKSEPALDEFLCKSSIEIGHDRWEVETQKSVPRDAKEIAACIGPLGRISNSLLMIDPYFNEDSKWRTSLLEILSACHARDGHFERIELHTAEVQVGGPRQQPRSSKYEGLKAALPQQLGAHLPRSVMVRVFVWKTREAGERYHRRYALTERGGIFVEGGLDRGAKGQTTDIGLLADNLFQQRWREYQEETAAFDLAGAPFEIRSSK